MTTTNGRLKQAPSHTPNLTDTMSLANLLEATHILSCANSLDPLMTNIVEGFGLLGFDRVRLYLLSDDKRHLIAKAQFGMDVSFVGKWFLILKNDIFYRLDGSPDLFIKYRDGDRKEPYEEELAQEGVDEFIYMPLTWQGKLLGLVVADNKFSQRTVTQEELNHLPIFVSHAAAALRNFYEREGRISAEWKAKKYAAVRSIFSAINSRASLTEIFELTCKAALKVFEVDHVAMVQFNSDFSTGRVTAEEPAMGLKDFELSLNGMNVETRLLADREPFAVKNVTQMKGLGRIRQVWQEYDLQSTLFVPVLVNQQLMGAFSLDVKGMKRPFNPDEIELAKIFATQIGLAIHNSQLLQDAEAQSQQLASFSQTTLSLTSKNDRDSLLQEITQHAVQLLGGRSGGIKLYFPEREYLQVICVYGPTDKLLGEKIPVGEGMAGIMIKQNLPHMKVPDYRKWPNRLKELPEGALTESMIMAAMQWQSQTIGMIFVEDEVTHQFTEQDVEKLKLFADQAAIAYHNADLVNKNLARAHRLQRLTHASNEIMQQLDTMPLIERLDLIARYTTEILDAEACGILLVNKSKSDLIFQTGFGYREDSDLKGKKFPIISHFKSGLTGHIAYKRELFNESGDALHNHFAVKGEVNPQTRSGQCFSLLAVPLKQRHEHVEELIGLLRVENKKSEDGEPHKFGRFTKEDELLIRLFADAVGVAVNSSEFVADIQTQKRRFRQMTRVSPTGIILNNRHGIIEYVNQKALDILGYRSEEVVGLHVRRVFTNPQEAFRINKQLLRAEGGSIKGHKTSLKGKIEPGIPIEMAAMRLKEGNSSGGTIGYFEDLREIQDARSRTEFLLTATKILTQTPNLEAGLDRFAEMMVLNWRASFCRICLLDDKGEMFKVVAIQTNLAWVDDKEKPHLGTKTAVSEWPGMQSLLDNKPYHLLKKGDPVTEPALQQYAKRIQYGDLHSLLVIPLKTRNSNCVGIMILGNLSFMPNPEFEEAQIVLAKAIANQTAVLIERAYLLKETQRRQRLLEQLDDGLKRIRAMSERHTLLYEACRLAASFSGRAISGLLKNNQYKGELVVEAVVGLSDELVKGIVLHSEGLIGEVLQSGEQRSTNEYGRWKKKEKLFSSLGLETLVAVPIKKSDGEMEGVLFVADRQKLHLVDEIDIEILERFAAQVSIALQTAELIDSEQLRQNQISLLHDISTYIQMEKELDVILHMVLTGITAGFGLQFNRAAVYLYDATIQKLEGQAGVGHRKKEHNEAAWAELERTGPNDLKSYREGMRSEGIKMMPLEQAVKQHYLPIDPDDGDLFSQVFNKQRGMLVPSDEFEMLPQPFVEAFEPTLPVVIVPLIARDETIGILITDKKFTQIPITDDDVEILSTFANTAAIVIDNTKLLKDAQTGKRRLNSLYQASNKLVSSQNPDEVAQSIVELALDATTAVAVRIILIEGVDANTQRTYVSAASDRFSIKNKVRPNGLSMKMMADGEPRIINNVGHHSQHVNPQFFKRKVKAAAGFPVSVEDSRIGVMWFYYDQHHSFDVTEIQALQFYVNSAALAYENARHIDNQEKMRLAAQALAGAHTLADVKHHILSGAINVLQADDAALWAYNQSRGQFIMADSVATFPKKDWLIFQKDEPSPMGTADTVMGSGWVGVEDVLDDETYFYLGPSTTKLLSRVGVKSFQGVRLHVDNEILGVLYVNYARRHQFSAEDEKIAKTFAHHASLAFKKAKLLERVQREQRTAKIVANLTTLNNNSSDLNHTLDSIVAGTMEALDCDVVSIYTYDQKRSKISHPPTTNGLWFKEKMPPLPTTQKNPLVDKMMEKDNIYLIDDVKNEPYFKRSRFTKDEKIKSLAVVPLKVGLEKVGIIFVNYRSPHRFTSDEISNLSLYADQTAVAIHNVQLYEREQKQIKALKAIDDAVHTISISENLEAIFNVISEQAVHVTGAVGERARYSHLVLLNKGNQNLAGMYPQKQFDKHRSVVNKINIHTSKKIGLTGRAMVSKKPVLVGDISKHGDYVSLHKETHSNLAVPILLGKEVIGVINVEHPEFDAFDTRDIQALQILAKHACVAIQKTRARKREQKQFKVLTAIDKAVSKINQSFDLEEILNTIVEQAVQLTSVQGQAARLGFLGLVEGNKVRFVATYPQKELQNVIKRVGDMPIMPQKGKRVGTTVRTAVSKQPLLIPDVRKHPDYITYRSQTRSELLVPILYRDEAIGIICVEHPQTNAFDDDDVQALLTLAEHAAVAIRNIRLYRDMKSIADISRKAATSLKLSPLLKEICQRIEADWDYQVITTIRLYDEEENVLKLESHWHHFYSKKVDGAFRKNNYTQQLDQGICGMVATTKKPYFTPNVHKATDVPNPLILISSTRSEMCVPILFGEKRRLIGVLDIQSSEENLFTKNNQKKFELLADQLAVAIQKAQDFEELQKTKGLVGSRTALAWMGMASNQWRHSIEGDALTIKESANMLSTWIEKGGWDDKRRRKFRYKLTKISELAEQIFDRPITPPLKSEEGVKEVIISDFVRERVNQLWEKGQYEGVERPLLKIDSAKEATVFISPEWLRLAFDLIMDNAIEAMENCEPKTLKIFTKIVKNQVQINIQDSGCGIPAAIKKRLFTAEFKTQKKGHLGRGLLIVEAIAETYGGEIFIKRTGKKGTVMVLSFPLSTPKG